MGDTPKVIAFVFAGRKENMRLQIPMMQRILEGNPDVEYHIWNLARVSSDGRYLKALPPMEQTQVRHDFFQLRPWRDNLGKVWHHYTSPEYKDALFIKLDDDIVFLEAGRFKDYVEAIDAHRGTVVSANVVNNGACLRVQPDLLKRYEPRSLLDAHSYKAFAEMCHKHFFAHWEDLVGARISVAPVKDWLSINAIGFDHPTLCQIVEQLGQPSPRMISGRAFPLGQSMGDEGAVNMLPRAIMRGFVVAHLAFGPQNITAQLLAHWRVNYGKIGRQYLADHRVKVKAVAV